MRVVSGTSIVILSLFAASVDAYAQRFGPDPSAEECQQWAAALEAGGAEAVDVLRRGVIPLCPAVAPSALTKALRVARSSTDTAYLRPLALDAGSVVDPAVFRAALDLAADRGSTDRARITALLVVVAHLGRAQDVPGWTVADFLTREVPADEFCLFGPAYSHQTAIDNGLPNDYEREAARVIDSILHRNGESRFVRSFARCARSAVGPDIPPSERIGAPAQRGWTSLTVEGLGTLVLSYDGKEIGRAEATSTLRTRVQR